MIRNVFGALLVVLVMSLPAWADIVVSIPDLEIPYTATSSEFTVSAAFTGSYDVDSYSLYLTLVPQAGASGVTFSTAADAAEEASTNYIFPSNVGWGTVLSNPLAIFGDDGVSGAAETITDATRNMITVQLGAILTSANVGDQYSIEFSGIGNTTDILDSNLDSIPGITWDPGFITITGAVIPEPGSVVMLVGLGLTSLVFYRRRRKK